MSDDDLDSLVKAVTARRMYLSYCEDRGVKPWKTTPAWAKDYAAIAVDFLGYGDDVAEAVLREVNA